MLGEKADTQNCKAHSASVEYFNGKLQQHRDHDDGKKARRFCGNVKNYKIIIIIIMKKIWIEWIEIKENFTVLYKEMLGGLFSMIGLHYL